MLIDIQNERFFESESNINPRIHFIAETKYHIIIAYLLKNSFFRKCESHLMISQFMDDAEGIYRRIQSLGDWDDVTLLNYYDLHTINRYKYIEKVKKACFVKNKIDALVKDKKIERLCLFTFGCQLANIMTNNKYIKELWLAEDGCFPYYSVDFIGRDKDVISFNKGFAHRVESFILKYIKNMFWKYNYDNYARVKNILLIKPEYYIDENISDVKIFKVEYDKSIISYCFEKVSDSMGYKHSDIYKNIDIIYIDGEYTGIISLEEELDIIEKILYCFNTKKILLKLRTQKNKKKESLFKRLAAKHSNITVDENNAHVPWEVIYYNNIDCFKEITLLSSGSTAAYSSKILFDEEIGNIDITSIFFEGRAFDNMPFPINMACEQFKKRFADSYNNKKFYFPKSIDELKIIAKEM